MSEVHLSLQHTASSISRNASTRAIPQDRAAPPHQIVSCRGNRGCRSSSCRAHRPPLPAAPPTYAQHMRHPHMPCRMPHARLRHTPSPLIRAHTQSHNTQAVAQGYQPAAHCQGLHPAPLSGWEDHGLQDGGGPRLYRAPIGLGARLRLGQGAADWRRSRRRVVCGNGPQDGHASQGESR